jgi:hypothetical protein
MTYFKDTILYIECQINTNFNKDSKEKYNRA